MKLLGGGADEFSGGLGISGVRVNDSLVTGLPSEVGGELPKMHITVSKASGSAIRAIEASGGEVVTRYYTPLTLRALIRPLAFERKGRPIPRDADPLKRRDVLYYTRWDKRGYLAKRPKAASPSLQVADNMPPATIVA